MPDADRSVWFKKKTGHWQPAAIVCYFPDSHAGQSIVVEQRQRLENVGSNRQRHLRRSQERLGRVLLGTLLRRRCCREAIITDTTELRHTDQRVRRCLRLVVSYCCVNALPDLISSEYLNGSPTACSEYRVKGFLFGAGCAVVPWVALIKPYPYFQMRAAS